ncbi:hypothetical protein [Pseudomonas syringae group genomosp. 3]|uniref:hypothetical protein n=1 Tax=Pseudomonas syringae group genomosp. 3 TaxID=251701 RepID=UPI000EFC34D2|nr:hypothetical protein [Pseudomonas syringae group genomosp. 3]
MKYTLAFFGVLLLAGCTNTPAELVADAKSYDGEIRTDQTAQSAYRNLREASRLCLESSPMGTPVTVESEFDPEIREGQITQRMIAQGVRKNISIIDVSQKTGSSPIIKLYTLKSLSVYGIKRPTLENISRWVAGSKSC